MPEYVLATSVCPVTTGNLYPEGTFGTNVAVFAVPTASWLEVFAIIGMNGLA